MRICSGSHSLLMLIAGGTASLMLAAGFARAAPRAQADLVEFEKMTWVEVKSALVFRPRSMRQSPGPRTRIEPA